MLKFDAIRPEQALWRMNFHIYESLALFHPRCEAERQCLLRLPRTQAVLFSLHTYQVALNALAPSDLAALGALGVMQHAN